MTNCRRYLSYRLRLESPVIITALVGDANSVTTLSYIPGTAIRGAVARALGDPGSDAVRQKEFKELVLGGSARYLNAYPDCEGGRTLPAPVSLWKEKNADDDRKTIDLAAFCGASPESHETRGKWPEDQLKGLSNAYVTIGSSRSVSLQPAISERLHNQRDRKKGRAWKKDNKDGTEEAHGAIFAFESLDAGQTFHGLIQVRASSEAECDRLEARIKDALGSEILVGRSRRAGYGGMARVEDWERQGREVEGSGGEGFQPVTAGVNAGDEFRLLLTSACVARDPDSGQIDPKALDKLVLSALKNRVSLIQRRLSFETIGGFNRKWRLETPQALAVSAGSVLVLEATENIASDELLDIEHKGLGERKVEGCGRLVFLDRPLPNVFLDKPLESRRQGPAGDAPDIVYTIQERILTAEMHRRIEEKAAQIAGSATRPPSNSLIGRLRTPLRGDDAAAINTLKAWLNDPDEDKRLRRAAMDQLDKCRIVVGARQRLSKWLNDATATQNVLNWLPIDPVARHYHVVSKPSAETFLKRRHLSFAVRLIDAVLAAMALGNKEKEAADDN